MKKVYQVKKYDCLSACVASILEEDLREVPIFVRKETPWPLLMEDFLRKRGYGVDYSAVPPKGHAILIVKVEGQVVGHALVVKDGRVCHDPTPGRKLTKEHLSQYRIDYYVILRRWQ